MTTWHHHRKLELSTVKASSFPVKYLVFPSPPLPIKTFSPSASSYIHACNIPRPLAEESPKNGPAPGIEQKRPELTRKGRDHCSNQLPTVFVEARRKRSASESYLTPGNDQLPSEIIDTTSELQVCKIYDYEPWDLLGICLVRAGLQSGMSLGFDSVRYPDSYIAL